MGEIETQCERKREKEANEREGESTNKPKIILKTKEIVLVICKFGGEWYVMLKIVSICTIATT